MIIYLFKCGSCNAELEEFFPLGQAPDTVTCDCQAQAKRRPSLGTFLTFHGSYNATK